MGPWSYVHFQLQLGRFPPDSTQQAGSQRQRCDIGDCLRNSIGTSRALSSANVRLRRDIGLSPKLQVTFTRDVPINEIATAFAFKHLGQYAEDYRRGFDETPSATGTSLVTTSVRFATASVL